MKKKAYKIEEKTCSTYEPVQLGVQGETEAREIRFDLSEWRELYGAGTAKLSHKRAQDRTPVLIVNTYMQEGDLVWTVSGYDTYYAGIGTATVTYEPEEGGIVKGQDIPTMVIPSQLGESTTGGEPGDDCTVDSDDLYETLAEVYGNEFIDDVRRD